MTDTRVGDPAADGATATGPAVLFEARGLSRSFRLPRAERRTAGWKAGQADGDSHIRRAVRDVTLTLLEGASLGIVGESGSGKSTLVRLLLGLDRPDAGTVSYRGRPVRDGRPRDLRWLRRDVQVVLQDPVASLDPRMTVEAIVAEPLECLRIAENHDARVDEVLRAVGLAPDVRRRYPHEFSGGQRQRIAIARALAPRPRVLVGDEPVSALDVSVRAQILDLLAELTVANLLSLVLVSHDLGVVARLCDQVAVMRAGEIVEQGGTSQVLENPAHPYTTALLAAVPRLPSPSDPDPSLSADPSADPPRRDPGQAGPDDDEPG
ncbi:MULTISPECIES: ABC transporter ATP-binding protein [Pseudofrankia]|uniref:ABC transporter ATP-binding protein n=1 Tax=Pseudofrankia TaxID=2994363 RepID=UPI000234D010|nr:MULTISPECIES: ATP-binding cassette domain-containing protein [Pseudofrankia]